MLEFNSTVFYGTIGVCVVDSIEKKKMGRDHQDYYVLKPVAQCSSTVYIPVNNETLLSKVRNVISKEEITKLIKDTDGADLWVENESERRNAFSRIVTAGTCCERLGLMRTLRKKQRELTEKSKRLHLSDERVFKEVSRIICDEFSYVLNLTSKEVEELIYK